MHSDVGVIVNGWWYRAYKADASAVYIPEVMRESRQHLAQGTHYIDRIEALRLFYDKHQELRP